MPIAILFDVDGTLVDSVDLHARAWQEALAHFGYPVEFARVRAQIGKGGDELLPTFVPERELELRGEEIKTYRGELFRREYLSQVKPFPHVPELFLHIRAQGTKVVLATSATRDELHALKTIAGIEGLVDDEVCADDVERAKPHPDVFAVALRKVGAAPGQTLAVGDTPYDAEAAGKAGIATVGMLCGGFPETTLRKAGCIALCADPSDLLAHYDVLQRAGD